MSTRITPFYAGVRLDPTPPVRDNGSTTKDGPGGSLRQQQAVIPGPRQLVRSRLVSSLPPLERIPATPADALLKTNPITPEMAAMMAPRILKKTVRDGDCWLRTTCLNPSGYSGASLTVDGRQRHFLAHRVMYVHAKGVIPEGRTIDHLCEHRNCVNPDHLEAVTHRQNVLRSRTNPYAINARRTREREAGAA